MKKQRFPITCPHCSKPFDVEKKRKGRKLTEFNSVICPECKEAILLRYFNSEPERVTPVKINDPIQSKGQTLRVDLTSFRIKGRNRE